jgi:hypothetical protein
MLAVVSFYVGLDPGANPTTSLQRQRCIRCIQSRRKYFDFQNATRGVVTRDRRIGSRVQSFDRELDTTVQPNGVSRFQN